MSLPQYIAFNVAGLSLALALFLCSVYSTTISPECAPHVTHGAKLHCLP